MGAIFLYGRKPSFWSLIGSWGIVFAVGGVSYLLTGRAAMEAYGRMAKPPLSPPGWLFPVVWTVLYGLMGISAWRIWRRKGICKALEPYAWQLLLNGAWTPVFFRLGLYWAAFVLLVVLEGVLVWMIASFRRIDRTAGNLQVPYALWVAFAGYLNAAVALLAK